MRKHIVIRIAQDNEPYEASWLVLDNTQDEAPAVIKTGAMVEAAAACEGGRATVLVPANTTFLSSVPMPAANQRRLLSAVPYALEDQLTEDVEDLHFCVAKRNAQGEVPTAVVSHEQMQSWTQQFQQLGIQVDVVTSELFSLPLEPNAWTVMLEDNTVLVRTDNEFGYSFDSDNFELLWPMILERAEERLPESIDVYDARTQSSEMFVVEGVELRQHLLHEPAISVMAKAVPKPGFSLNFLQGEYSRKEQLGKVWRPWIPAGALAATLLVANFAITLAESIQLNNQAEDLQKQIEALYLEAFPGAKVQTVQGIIESETKRRLAALKGGGGTSSSEFLTLLSAVGERFSKTQGLELQRISYRSGKLDVALTISDLQKLDSLKQQIMESNKVSVDIQSATSRNGKVQARIQIVRTGA